MPEFSRQSKEALMGVDKRLVSCCELAIKVFDFSVIQGIRSIEEQRINVARGKSWTMNSKHLDGKAVDLAPFPIEWADTEMFCVLAGVMMAAAHTLKIKLRWGGDWDSDRSTRDETRRDYGHFELVD